MKLDSHITSEFSDMINELYSEPTEQTVYGVAKEMTGGSGFGVLLDGAENLIPVESAVTLSNDDRVQVVIQNHKATVVANMTDKVITETKTDEAISVASTTIIQEVTKEAGFKYYTYSNGSDINISDGSAASIIIRFSFEMEKADYIIFHGQIQCNVTLSSGSDSAVVKATMYINGTKINLEPTETWGSGSHIFSLKHIFTSGATDSGSLIVYLEATGGSVSIPNKQIIAWLSSIGATGQGGAFDGLLNIDETYDIIPINNITVKEYSDDVSTSSQSPNTNELTDAYSEITIPNIYVSNYIDRLSPINNYTEDVINYLDAFNMTFDPNYVYINNQNRFALIDTTSADQVVISSNYTAIHPSIIGIEDVSIDADISTLFAVSFDNGDTWWNYVSDTWITVAQATSGQDASSIESISTNAWAEKFANGDSIKFRFVLTGSGYLDNITIHYIN